MLAKYAKLLAIFYAGGAVYGALSEKGAANCGRNGALIAGGIIGAAVFYRWLREMKNSGEAPELESMSEQELERLAQIMFEKQNTVPEDGHRVY